MGHDDHHWVWVMDTVLSLDDTTLSHVPAFPFLTQELDTHQLAISKQWDLSRVIPDKVTSLKRSREDVCDGIKQFRNL